MSARSREFAVVTSIVLGILTAPGTGVAQGEEQAVSPQTPAPAAAPATAGIDVDTIRAGRFDNGRMWTFEYPPVDYLRSEYGFEPDSAWFRKARLGALRIPNCSASFVSPNGLVATNHHCAREHVSAVAAEGEPLLDEGFYATTLEEERAIEGFEADRLISIVDVTDEVHGAQEGIDDIEARAQAREAAIEEIEARILAENGGSEAGIHVEPISLYNGGRYSVYVFRRYTDVRLVMAPELQLGYFGGDPDNFTYPRYSLDFTFLRVYENGEPLDTSDDYFSWSTDGVRDGDLVFVIGNPGSTSRIQTVAELAFRRDVSDKGLLQFIDRRIEALQEYYDMDPETAESLDLRNEIFSLLNSQKAYGGIIAGLHDPVILAKRQDAEASFKSSIEGDSTLSASYSGLIERMAEIQEEKRSLAPGFAAFLALTTPEYGSATLVRAIWAFQYLSASGAGAPSEALEDLRSEVLAVPDQPIALEEILIEARLNDLVDSYGAESRMTAALLEGRTPEGTATVVVNGSVLVDSARTARALELGSLGMSDPAIRLIIGMLGDFAPFQQRVGELAAEEEEIAIALGRARFDVYGSAVPPDATFSLRLADGIVAPYEYNGTIAPPFTTFYGMYDRFYAFGEGAEAGDEWRLPQRWSDRPPGFDLATPLNFVSTADITGGNSGSPVVNSALEVVGLAFDGNIESLSGEYIFLTERARTVAVDSRGILEALAEIYNADRLVEELRAGATVSAR